MCGGDNKKPALAPAKPAPPVPQIVQDMMRATDLGPTGYTDAMRANMGLNTQQGGAKPVSGMTRSVPSFTGYVPVAAKPDPLIPILAKAALPKPVAKPVAKTPVVPITTAPSTNPNAALASKYVWTGGRNAR